MVVAWAREATLDVATIASNTVEIEWPPRSGRRIKVPELDRAAWLPGQEARGVVVAAQAELLDRLAGLLHDAPLDTPIGVSQRRVAVIMEAVS